MAITMPYTLRIALLALLMAYAFESNYKTATISAIPQEYHNFVVKVLWLMEEFWSSGHAAVLRWSCGSHKTCPLLSKILANSAVTQGLPSKSQVGVFLNQKCTVTKMYVTAVSLEL